MSEQCLSSVALPLSGGEPLAALGGEGRFVRDGGLGFADGADGKVLSDLQNALLADIEARLTQEVRGLIASLAEFGRRAQLIGEEIPDHAKFCKSIPAALSVLTLQFAYSLSQGVDVPVFLDDGAEYLRKLHLSLDDLVREIDLDGRRFLAIALIEKSSAEILGGHQGGGDR